MRKTDYRAREEMVIATADITLTRAQCGCTVSNLGAAGAVNVTLPANSQPGDVYTLQVDAAQYLKFKGGAATQFVLGAVTGTAGQGVRSNAIGDLAKFVCLAANLWRVQAGGSLAAN